MNTPPGSSDGPARHRTRVALPVGVGRLSTRTSSSPLLERLPLLKILLALALKEGRHPVACSLLAPALHSTHNPNPTKPDLPWSNCTFFITGSQPPQGSVMNSAHQYQGSPQLTSAGSQGFPGCCRRYTRPEACRHRGIHGLREPVDPLPVEVPGRPRESSLGARLEASSPRTPRLCM